MSYSDIGPRDVPPRTREALRQKLIVNYNTSAMLNVDGACVDLTLVELDMLIALLASLPAAPQEEPKR